MIFHRILLNFLNFIILLRIFKISTFSKYFLNQNVNIKAHLQIFQNLKQFIKSHNYNLRLIFFHYPSFFLQD